MGKTRSGPEVNCEKCGTRFRAWRSDRPSRFCSSTCAPHGRPASKPSTKCLQCGALFRRYGGGHEAKFCSRLCYIASNPRTPTAGGYILVYDPANSDRKSGQVFEHRSVLAKHLGRPLEKHETVHHIDGDRGNNAIENLQLRSGKHGKGVVHQCADCGSRNVVSATI